MNGSMLTTLMHVPPTHRGLILVKDVHKFPSENDVVRGGTIDAWWLVQRYKASIPSAIDTSERILQMAVPNSCGLTVMAAWLLSMHRVWSMCLLRVLTIAGSDMNSIELERQIETLLLHLRIKVCRDLGAKIESDRWTTTEVRLNAGDRPRCRDSCGSLRPLCNGA